MYDFWVVLKAKGIFKTDTFWFFEPFGWVEQMKKVFSNGELIFPFKKIPLNHPKGFKNNNYKRYDYTKHETNAATFGYYRNPGMRIHAARDLYYEVGEPIYAIADGKVISINENFYRQTDAIVIEHDYEYKEGSKLIVRYAEIKNNDLKVGDIVKQGQQIASIAELIPAVKQPASDKRGMLHIEMFTGEVKGSLSTRNVIYEEMLYAKSGKYEKGMSFRRRKDLFDPLELLEKMLENSINQGLIK